MGGEVSQTLFFFFCSQLFPLSSFSPSSSCFPPVLVDSCTLWPLARRSILAATAAWPLVGSPAHTWHPLAPTGTHWHTESFQYSCLVMT